MEEEWRDIEEFPGYQVSNLGNVRALNRVVYCKSGQYRHLEAKPVALIKNAYNFYLYANFHKNGKAYTRSVHRLVASAFIPNPENKREVNHKDGNKENNAVDNLEWVTPSENQTHSYATGLHPNVKSCILVDECGNRYKFVSQQKAGEFLGRNPNYIGDRYRYNNYDAFGIDGKRYEIIYLE